MLTEEGARVLLERAAATIEVQPGTPIVAVKPPRRWAVPLIATAAVAAAVVAGFTLVDRDDAADPSPAPEVTDRVPSVFAYDAESARRLLTTMGLQVEVVDELKCATEGRADHTEPTTGTRVTPGELVRLYVTKVGKGGACPKGSFDDRLAWKILDFANGRGPSPTFASDLYVSLNGKTVDLTNALQALALVTRRPGPGAFLAVTSTDLAKKCHPSPETTSDGGSPRAFASAFSMSIVFPSNGPFDPACNVTNVYLADDGSIADLEVTVPSFITDPPAPTPHADPDGDEIAQRFAAFARGEADSLPVDTPVKLFLDGAYRTTITPTEAMDQLSYAMCSGLDAPACKISATRLVEDQGNPAITDELPGCGIDRLPTITSDQTGGSNFVVLGVPEPRSCAEDWAVQLWYNDVGQITAVNLLLGSTP